MSQTDTQSTTIDGHTFTVAMLDPFVAQDIMVDVVQAIGPALGGVAGAAGSVLGAQKVNSLLDIKLDDPKLAAGLTGLFKGLNKAKLRELMRIMMSVTVYEGENGSAKLDKVAAALFRGNLQLMYGWFWFALRVNFADFFAWGQSVMNDALASQKAAPSQSTSKDTGQP